MELSPAPVRASVVELLDELNTWSAFQNFFQQDRDDDDRGEQAYDQNP